MKLLYILLFSAMTLGGLSACQNENGPTKPPKDKTDTTTDCKYTTESGGYSTFYKPPIGWFGDPIPFSDNGEFYIFYLQDWRSGFPFLHPWHMASSTDLSSFTFEGEIIPCGKEHEQDVALCTGGVIKSRENGMYYAFYAGHQWNPAPGKPIQALLLTTSPDLKTWTKDKSFYIAISGDGYNMHDLRDPHVYYDEENNIYRMIVSGQRYGYSALVQYTSTDLYNWTLIEPFYTDPDVAVLECADIFKEGEYWYLVYSHIKERKVHYRYSKSQNGPWIKPEISVFDGLAFYAGKTASNGKDRYIFGWCPTRIGDGAEDQWGGSMIAHRLLFQEDGTIKFGIPQGVDKKFSKKQEIIPIEQFGTISKTDKNFTLTGNAFVSFPRITKPGKIETSIQARSENDVFGFTFGACGNKDELYLIQFDLRKKQLAMFKETPTGAKKQTDVQIKVPDNLIFDVKIVIEKSICVIYINNETAFSNRIDKMQQNPWNIFSKEGNNITFSNINLLSE